MTMLEIVTKLGISGGVGILIGLFAVWWVEPTTTGGAFILIFISVSLALTANGVLSNISFYNRNSSSKDNS
jgi:hypothetical protein